MRFSKYKLDLFIFVSFLLNSNLISFEVSAKNNNIAEENLNIAKQDLIKTIINAYSEVEQTLFAENSNNILLDAYEAAAEQAEAAYKLSRERYDSGLVDLIAVMDSQQRWFLSRSQVLAAKKNKIHTRLNLLLAFGGTF